MTVHALSNDIIELLSVIKYHHNGRYELHAEHFDLIFLNWSKMVTLKTTIQ